MALKQFFTCSVLPLIVIGSLWGEQAKAVVPVQFKSPMGFEKWKMTGNRLRCGLSLVIPNYGIAYFEQYAAKPPHFIMSKWEQVQRELPAVVYAKEPVWKPRALRFPITKTVLTPGEFALFLPRDPALSTLTYLAKGYNTRIQYRSEQGFPVTVILSPIHFQKVYAKYQRCLGNLLPFNYEHVKTTVLLFDTNDYKLEEAQLRQLKRIVIYVSADPQVKKINIYGYSDDRGRKSINNAMSEARAKAVEKFLLSQGINKDMIYTTWFGILDPVAPNTTEAGMALNRRVVVEIEKKI
ncbi:OmpA family protein [Legionella taurinensis]|uniref:Flagellar protein MotY n=1 Tax=Legionella taurinensis TaxID=70611 RepID=A0A3A5L2Z2_9GAMM|nr:OmpA family protein [Legionella taurinensis]MDX1836321.1 OmpA family protein [Legionella taurinensis]PUT41927.1 flagellar protein MotY [Legionella taurinensis]PUT44716.1 flagellar protein MotY [Legionella taurinensis]PUT48036.1 flagellar protein MotY [Legionella taurinensis]PUT48850.1 flagellar protein MotY [Legionella taurinensis]